MCNLRYNVIPINSIFIIIVDYKRSMSPSFVHIAPINTQDTCLFCYFGYSAMSFGSTACHPRYPQRPGGSQFIDHDCRRLTISILSLFMVLSSTSSFIYFRVIRAIRFVRIHVYYSDVIFFKILSLAIKS